ncbi:MAG TPA: UDP-N-acetylglucosamine--N-acetylmuramyl-(pentapeptide) pyrophosphoryl-undecaprenol N-acetylglucosamine transferase, partial [Rikenellaceae bacterium]|nr:UDP-N-acetylglucosamine--N-acetylmuramyl-(pentapeptide) pyrophosphoryl-undecaprenol N-acetylglucosamine transferase [Rikenellaceae bacterium]
MALVRKDAAILVKDSEAQEKLLPAAIELLADSERVRSMQENIAKLA